MSIAPELDDIIEQQDEALAVACHRIAELEAQAAEDGDALARVLQDNDELRQSNMSLASENAKLRRSVDNIKVRSYELGQRELHDMALAVLLEVE